MVTRITLMDFYQIEALFKEGFTKAEILQTLEKGNFEKWEKQIPHFDFTEIGNRYKENPDTFSDVLAGDYQITFVTLPGLERILEIKFGKLAHIDFHVEETGISGLHLSEEEQAQLKQLLSSNWRLVELVDQGLTIEPAK